MMNVDQIVKAIGLGFAGIGAFGILLGAIGIRRIDNKLKKANERYYDISSALIEIKYRYNSECNKGVSSREKLEDHMAAITNRALDILDQNT